MKTLRETVHEQLAQAMEAGQITNAELARRMNCSPVTSLLMIQQKRNLQLDTVEKLARAMGMRAEIMLIEGTTKKNGSKKAGK